MLYMVFLPIPASYGSLYPSHSLTIAFTSRQVEALANKKMSLPSQL